MLLSVMHVMSTSIGQGAPDCWGFMGLIVFSQMDAALEGMLTL